MGLSYFSNQIQLLTAEMSKKSREPLPLKIYHSQARNIFFRLQALSRIFKNIHNKALFKSLQEEFKLLEDALGRIDYYHGFFEKFSANKQAPASFLDYFKHHMDHECEQLSLVLKDVGVQLPSYGDSVTERLKEASWLGNPDDERKAIATMIIGAIDDLHDDYKKGKLDFHDIEEGLHEFRRKLRWISIYMSSCDGLFQLKKTKVIHPDLKSYQTDFIIKLPYNVMPALKKGVKAIEIESPNFYALSWLIQELGDLKDQGLTYHAMDAALKENKKIKDVTKLKTALQSSIKNKPDEIIAIAQNITDDFLFRNGVLSRIKRDIYRSITE